MDEQFETRIVHDFDLNLPPYRGCDTMDEEFHNKIAHDFDLNLPADHEPFDLNKFPAEGCEAYENEELQKIFMEMLKIYLPTFY
ncbi:hypothetical protein M5689_024451 [Euphorbia peplus]|nr:hypothetical protein M5689_024451 [Euphorbia peplus]